MQLIRLTIALFGSWLLTACHELTKSTQKPLIETKLVIKNTSSHQVDFTLNIDNKYPLDKTRILSNILELADSTLLPIPVAAWLFVTQVTKHATPITAENWINDPIIYLNSIGIGFCDDQAAVLANIWRWLGYESRIWGLNGHVVPEVYYNDSWHMLDPDYVIFYLNDNSDIASVEEIANNPRLVTRPITGNNIYYNLKQEKKINFLRRSVKNSRYLSKIYSTKGDNAIAKWYKEIDIEQTDFSFSVPTNAKVVFPETFVYPNIDSTIGLAIKVVLYNSNKVQKVKVPHIFIEARGNEEIITNNKYFSKNRQIMNLDLNYNNKEIKVEMTSDSTELFYAINHNIFYPSMKIKNVKIADSTSDSLTYILIARKGNTRSQ